MIAVLYGHQPHEPAYMESVLIETKNIDALNLTRKTFAQMGWIGFRTMYYDDIPQAPDFKKAITI